MINNIQIHDLRCYFIFFREEVSFVMYTFDEDVNQQITNLLVVIIYFDDGVLHMQNVLLPLRTIYLFL